MNRVTKVKTNYSSSASSSAASQSHSPLQPQAFSLSFAILSLLVTAYAAAATAASKTNFFIVVSSCESNVGYCGLSPRNFFVFASRRDPGCERSFENLD